MNHPKVSIIILNWNGLEDTIECLESLKRITYRNYDVIVVDNGSSGNDADILEEKCAGYIQLIRNDKNYGFAEGNNIGIRYALQKLNPDYILLLNNDTIVTEEFLEALVNVSENGRDIGAAQSVILKPGGEIVDSLGQELWTFGAIDRGINTERRKYTLDKYSEIFGPCAAVALYQTEALTKIGLFDVDFFVVFEDVDISWRLRLGGYKTVLVSNSIIYHKRGISGKAILSNRDLAVIKKYNVNKNWLLIALRYYPISAISKSLVKYALCFFLAVYYSIRLGKLDELIRCVKKAMRLRRYNIKNPLLLQIQKEWIRS